MTRNGLHATTVALKQCPAFEAAVQKILRSHGHSELRPQLAENVISQRVYYARRNDTILHRLLALSMHWTQHHRRRACKRVRNTFPGIGSQMVSLSSKAGANRGGHTDAETEARRGGANLVSAVRLLYDRIGMEDVTLVNERTFVFSVAVTPEFMTNDEFTARE